MLKVTYRVYEERTNQNLSVRQLADKSGVSVAQISYIENGRSHPTVYTLCLLSLALGVDPCSLFMMFDISNK